MQDYLIVFLGTYLIFVEAAIAVYYFYEHEHNKKRGVFTTLLSLVLGYFFARFAGLVFYHAQPFIANDVTNPLIYHPADNAFPSDHATIAAVVAMLVFAKNKKLGAYLFVLAVLVGVGRVLGGVHYPIDVIVGFILGTSAVLISNFLFEKYFKY